MFCAGDFLNNIFSGLAEEVVQVSQNQTVSSIIESLIAVGSPSNLRTLFVALAADLSIAFLDRFACHVFEKLTQKLPQFFYPPTQNSTDEEEDYVSQDKFVESFEGVCEFVDSNFETLMTHMYGSHVLRALLEALSGVPVVNELKKSQKSGHGRYFNKGMSLGCCSWLLACLTSQQHASASQRRICSDNCLCCSTEIEVAVQT